MTQTKQALFHEYEEAKRSIKELEEKIKEIKPLLLQHIPEDTEMDTGTAVFTLSKGKPRWTYSDSTIGLDKDLKEIKKTEEQTGVAEKVYGDPFIVCNLK